MRSLLAWAEVRFWLKAPAVQASAGFDPDPLPHDHERRTIRIFIPLHGPATHQQAIRYIEFPVVE